MNGNSQDATLTNVKATKNRKGVDILGFAAVKRQVPAVGNTALIEIKSLFFSQTHHEPCAKAEMDTLSRIPKNLQKVCIV